jgi:hypothetical protein
LVITYGRDPVDTVLFSNMPVKDFPSGLTDLLNRGWVRVFPTVDISLSDGTILHLSTVPITVAGITYDDKLKSVKSVKSTQNRSVDRAELVIDNTDLSVGDTLLDESNDDLLDNLPASYGQIYVNTRNRDEKYLIPRMSGLLYTFSEDGETDLNITLISDAYAGGGVADLDVKPSCVFRYKDGYNCTYSGDLPTCDLSFSGANGCVAHFGWDDSKSAIRRRGTRHRRCNPRGIHAIQHRPKRGHRHTGGGGCFFGDTPIYTGEDYAEKAIRSFKGGDPLLGFGRDTFVPQQDTADQDVFRHTFRNWYHLLFSDGSHLNVTGTHPFFPMPGERVLVEDFTEGMKFRRNVGGRMRTVKLIRKQRKFSLAPMTFFNVPAAETHDYYANGFHVSNLKSAYADEFPLRGDSSSAAFEYRSIIY